MRPVAVAAVVTVDVVGPDEFVLEGKVELAVVVVEVGIEAESSG